METVTIPPDMPDLVTEMADAIGISCEQANGQYVVPAGQGAAAQAWLDDPARLTEAVTRYRKRFKEASIEYAAVEWREARGDEKTDVIDFAHTIASWISVSVALGNTLTAEQTTLAQWAHDILESVEPFAQAAYNAEQRSLTDTNLQNLYNHGSNPGNAPEFVSVRGNGRK